MCIIMNNQLEINVLTKIKNNLLMQVDDINTRLKQLSSSNYTYVCDFTNLTFTTLEDYEKYKKSKKYFKAAGIEPTKCKLCNNLFYGDDYKLHLDDGRCIKSRTDKDTGIVYENMNKKSRAKKEKKEKKEKKDKKKKKKSPKRRKLVIVDLPEGFAAPKEEVEPELYSHVTKEKTKEKKKSDSMFFINPTHTLIDLPDYYDDVNAEWFMRLHRNMKEGGLYYNEMFEGFMAIDNHQDEYKMYLKDNIIYDTEDNDPAWRIEKQEYYYKLIDLESKVAPSSYDDDKQLSELTNGMKITADIYLELHKDIRTKDNAFLTEEYKQKRFDNYTQISNYSDYTYFDGYLMASNEYKFRIQNLDDIIYDIELCEDEEDKEERDGEYNSDKSDSDEENEYKEL